MILEMISVHCDKCKVNKICTSDADTAETAQRHIMRCENIDFHSYHFALEMPGNPQDIEEMIVLQPSLFTIQVESTLSTRTSYN